MSRHRDIRNMDYSDEYEGYDDVYGHSIDDDYYISPSNRQFMYNRENSTRSSEDGIKEEDEVEAQLTDTEKLKLESCIDEINRILGSLNIPRIDLVDFVLTNKFDVEKAVSAILDDPKFRQTEQSERKEKDVTVQTNENLIRGPNGVKKEFVIPNIFDSIERSNSLLNNDTPSKEFIIPNIFDKKLGERILPKTKPFVIPKLTKLNSHTTNTDITPGRNDTNSNFNSLSELVSTHLNNAPVKCEAPFSEYESKGIKSEINLKESLDKMADLQLSDSKSLSCTENKSPLANNNWHIDLSVALRSTNSLSPVTNKNRKGTFEKFSIPFIDCEIQSLSKQTKLLPKHRKLLPCAFDISEVLHIATKYQKHRSRFGKALCLSFKRPRFSIKRNNDIHKTKLKVFNFQTPSPDDFVSSHLRR